MAAPHRGALQPLPPLQQLAAFSGSSDAASARMASVVDAAGVRWILKQWRTPGLNDAHLERRKRLPEAVATDRHLVTGTAIEWRGTPWLAQPWIDGVNLLTQVRIGRRETVERCIDAGFGFADALNAAPVDDSRLSVVHFDLAPSNVLRTGQEFFLTDFEHWDFAPGWYNHVDVLLSFGSAANSRGLKPRGRGAVAAFCHGPWNRSAESVIQRFASSMAAGLLPATNAVELSSCVREVVDHKSRRQGGTGAFDRSWQEVADALLDDAALPVAAAVEAASTISD